MRKLLFLLLVSIACIAKAGNSSYVPFTYLGTDVELCDSTTMQKLRLHKNSFVYVKDSVSDKMKEVMVAIGKNVGFVTFKPKLKQGEKLTQLFKKLQKPGHEIKNTPFMDMVEWETFQEENRNSHILALVCLTASKSLLLNATGKDVDIYRDDSFVQELAAGSSMVVDKPEQTDSVNLLVAGNDAKNVPTVVTVKFAETAKDGVSGVWFAVVAVVVLLFGAVVAVLVVHFFQKRAHKDKGAKKDANNKTKVDDNDFRLVVNSKKVGKVFRSYALEQGRGKNKQIIYLLQKVKFPSREYLEKYVEEIVAHNYNGDKGIAKFIIDEVGKNADVSTSLELPVEFHTVDEAKDGKEWMKVKTKKDKFFARFIAPFVEPDPQIALLPDEPSQQEVDYVAELDSQVARLAAFVPATPDGEVVPESVMVSMVELNGVCDSLRTIGKSVGEALADIDNVRLEMNSAANEQMSQLKINHEEEMKILNEQRVKEVKEAVDNTNHEWLVKTEAMQKEHAEAVAKAARLEVDFKCEKENKEKALSEIGLLNRTIARKDEESKAYNSLLVFYRSCRQYAALAVEMFDTVSAVERLASRLYNAYLEKGKDRDTFCYFMTRVNRKFLSSTEGIKNLHEVYEIELRMLASTGLVPKKGWIDCLLESQKDESMWPEQLKMKLYRDAFEQYCGIAVVMADEYAYLMSNMVDDVDKDIEKKISEKSEYMQKLVGKLGYKLVYARPFTPVTQYENVENTEFVDLGIAKDTIVEIKKMGVAYGTKSPKTEVSVQQ